MSKVIITGGLGVLGSAVARAFSRGGHPVALIDRAAKPADCEWICIEGVDLTDPLASQAAFGLASAALGGADVLVNAAGGFIFDLVNGSASAWDAMYKANLVTCAHMCSAAIAGLSDNGAIVNVGGGAADEGGVGMAPYAASKSGVARLTESLAAELSGRIRVNAVLPLVLDTPQNRADMPDVDPRNWTTPEAVADAIVFLASDAARGVNGALLRVTAPTRH